MSYLIPSSLLRYTAGPSAQGMQFDISSSRYYNPIYTGSVTTLVVTLNQLYAIPFFAGPGGVLSEVAAYVTAAGAAGSVLRVGVYRATSRTDLYPGPLVCDAGEFAGDSTGLKNGTVSAVMTPGLQHYVVFIAGVSAPTVRAASFSTLNGVNLSSTLVPGSGWTKAQAYGALPSTFPAGGSAGQSTMPIVGVQFSAVY